MEGRDVIDGDEVSLASNGVVKSNGSLMGYNSSPSAWLIEDHVAENCSSVAVFGQRDKKTIKQGKIGSGETMLSEAEMMRERFAKLMLGGDMSGSGNGVCSALALSNSITNLCATIFGKLWRLEPLPPEKKNVEKGDGLASICERSYCGNSSLLPNSFRWKHFRGAKCIIIEGSKINAQQSQAASTGQNSVKR